MNWKVLADWARLATTGGSWTWKTVKIIGAAFAVLLPFSLDDKVYAHLSNGTFMTWHPRIGLLITIVIVSIWVIVSLVIAILRRPRLKFDSNHIDAGSWERHFRVPVKNTSWGTTIHDCEVVVADCDPSIGQKLFRLHCMDQGVGPDEERFDLKPGQSRMIDVVVIDNSGNWRLNAVAFSVGINYDVKKIKHRLTLIIHGRDAYPCKGVFVFEPTDDGSLELYEEGKRKKSTTKS